VVTVAEHEAATNRLIAAVVQGRQPPTVERPAVALATDSGGNLGGGADGPGVPVYRVPVGMRVDIHRVSMWGQGYTPAAPLTAGWIMLCPDTGTNPPDYFFPTPPATAVLPAGLEDGSGAVRLNGGQQLVAVGGGLPVAPFVVLVRLQVRLWETYPRQIGEPGR
jgi:hypothetical protein